LNSLKNWFQHPITKDFDLDDPKTTILRHEILSSKPFLIRIYREWYEIIFQHINEVDKILEIGSGAGFFNQFSKEVFLTDVLHLPGINFQCDGHYLPVKSQSLHSIVMVNVLHHMSDPDAFLMEASRSLQINGTICMIEPWATQWSSIFYPKFHHEKFDKKSKRWGFSEGGPLSGSNQAIPWIIFSRDLSIFNSKFPNLSVEIIKPIMPFVYILSGGISLRFSMPVQFFNIIRKFERLFESKQGLFALIVIRKKY
jgi:SAM-dependent methyltransferase